MQATNENATQYRSYESIEEMLAAVAGVKDDRAREVDPKFHSFVGRRFSDWAEVYAAARGEWADGIARLEAMLNELNAVTMPKPKSRKRRTRFDEAAGDDVDYDRLRAGQDFWRLTRRESTDGPATLTLIVEMSTRASVDAADILWRGAAAIVLTKLLEDAGYRVELWALEKTVACYKTGTYPDQCDGVCLKRTGDPLDMSTLINAVSGWFFRTVFFRAKCLSKHRVQNYLGRPRVPSAADLDQFSRDSRRHLIAQIWDREAAIKLIHAKLAELAG